MASESKESAANNPGLHTTPDDATKGYIMQQTVTLLYFTHTRTHISYVYVCVYVSVDGIFLL